MVVPLIYWLDFFATRAHIRQNDIDTILVDDTQGGGRNTQFDPAVFRFHPEAAILQVRQKAAFGFVVSVGNMVAALRLFPGDLAYTCHLQLLKDSENWKKMKYIEKNHVIQ